jgi:hypothetical protein
MNPSQPTNEDMREIEDLFFAQMKHRTRMVTDPVLQRRMSLDYQFSDLWVVRA